MTRTILKFFSNFSQVLYFTTSKLIQEALFELHFLISKC